MNLGCLGEKELKFSLFIFLLIVLTSCGDNKKHEFEISVQFNQDGRGIYSLDDFDVNNNFLYEDSLYIITKECYGEFGGNVIFENKITKKKYATSSVCAVIVNKFNNKYYVTSSLNHMGGFTEVVEIEDPTKLDYYDSSNDFEYSDKGKKVLLDTSGIVILVSFFYKDEFYHIVNDYKKVYLSKMSNDKLEIIDTIIDKKIYSNNEEIYRTKDNHLIVFLPGIDDYGYIEIYENKIDIVWVDLNYWDKVYEKINKKVKKIDEIKKWSRVDSIETFESSEGGIIYYYYLEKDLKKIISKYFGENGKSINNYYLSGKELIYYTSEYYKYNRPMYYDSLDMIENHDSVYFDINKSRIDTNFYYFSKGQIKHYYNNPLKHFFDENKENKKEILSKFDELKGR